jgi:hypothetical protein
MQLSASEMAFASSTPNFAYGDDGAVGRARETRREALSEMRQLVETLESQNRNNFTPDEDAEFRAAKAAIVAADATLSAASYLDERLDGMFSGWAREDRRSDADGAREVFRNRLDTTLHQLHQSRFGDLAERCRTAAESGDSPTCEALWFEVETALRARSLQRDGIFY